MIVGVGVLAGTLVWFSSVRAVEMPSVVINELMWMGSSASSADEWIELRNTTTAPVDVSGWSLTKLSSEVETPMLTIPSGTIPAHGFFVIANFNAENSRLAVTPDLVETDVSLVNSQLQIKLYDATSTLVDTADDGSGNPFSGEYVSGSVWKSMERNPNGADGTVAESWHASVRHDGYDDALKEFGTPGSRNSNRPPVIAVSVVDEARVGDTVFFDATETTDESAELTFAWNFGDGTSGSGATPAHSFALAGTYTVRLSVSDGEETSISETTITINASMTPAPISPEDGGGSTNGGDQGNQNNQSDQGNQDPNQNGNQSTSQNQNTQQDTNNARDGNRTPRARGTSQANDTVVFNELFPDPDGIDRGQEFLELKNVSSSPLNLRGWAVAIGKKKAVFSRDVVLGPGGMMSFTTVELGVTLPNANGATLFLLDASGAVVNGVAYGKARTDKSFSRSAKGDWQWVEPTPGIENVFPTPQTNVAGARATIQTIEGSVVKKVGRSMVLDTESGEQRAVASLNSDVSFRDLRAGDRVRLTGELRQTDNGQRIYPRTMDDIEVIDEIDTAQGSSTSVFPSARAATGTQSATTAVASNDRSILETTVFPFLLSAAVGFGVWGWRRKRVVE